MRKLITLAAASLLSATTLLAQAPAGAARRKVAVLDFNYATVRTSVQAVFGTDQDIGKGITDLLINKLVNDGTYRVIERQAMSKIIAEQNFSNSNRADASSAAQIGKLLGVDAIIIGDITTFGRDDHNTNIGGGGGSYLGKYGLGGLGVKKGQANVAITARLVDVNTGEILASTTGTGTSKRSGTSLLGGGGSGLDRRRRPRGHGQLELRVHHHRRSDDSRRQPAGRHAGCQGRGSASEHDAARSGEWLGGRRRRQPAGAECGRFKRCTGRRPHST